MASLLFDPIRVFDDATPMKDLSANEAPPAGDAAVASAPNEPGYRYNRARALLKAADHADGPEQRAELHRRMLEDRQIAMSAGYPMALNNLSTAFANRKGHYNNRDRSQALLTQA